jgi:hypothetical protein
LSRPGIPESLLSADQPVSIAGNDPGTSCRAGTPASCANIFIPKRWNEMYFQQIGEV